MWDKHRNRRLVEPFCGGLAVTTGLMPQRALLNDINPHVINLYEWLKRGLTISFEMKNDAAAFDGARDRFDELLEAGQRRTSEAATLFYYLNRTGYNGLCRFNARGLFNVPFGKYRTINYRTDFSGLRYALANWRNPEWTFVREGPTWQGRRVATWDELFASRSSEATSRDLGLLTQFRT